MTYWDEADTFMGLSCHFPMKCPMCQDTMNLDNAKLFKFFLPNVKRESYAIDVVMGCPSCGMTDIFGVAISQEHYIKTFKKIKGYLKKNPDAPIMMLVEE